MEELKPALDPGGRDDVATAAANAEDLVISGISCRLPKSENMAEFCKNLMEGEDMVTEDNLRWTPGLHGLPRRSGKVQNIDKFDAGFFGVHPKQANRMDPQMRMLLEVTYEALIDAGVNPEKVRGSRTGVFVGVSVSESHCAWSGQLDKMVGYEMTGCTGTMFANRLSYYFDFKGPSYMVDTACSSSLMALDHAVRAIRTGLCDAAIVGGSNLCLNPALAMQFQKLGMLSPDGACKTFDSSGNGYCRSEGVIALYIQRAEGAKRVYASVLHTKNNCDGNKKHGITFPSGAVQNCLLSEVYSEAGVDPAAVSYVEAHGTGTKAGDPQEVNSIVDMFCTPRRTGPLLIGSVKSNMGHPEPASGLAAVAKVILSMEQKKLPANLHYKTPNPDIPGLQDGRLKVVTECTPWEGGIVGINSFGFGGSNVHVVLKSNDGVKSAKLTEDQDTRLFVFSSRTKEGVEGILDHMCEHAKNVHLQGLYSENAASSTNTHPFRGYALLNTDNKLKEIQKCESTKRPVWFVFSGMGTQWPAMARELMGLAVFRESIMASSKVLAKYDVDLCDILENDDKSITDNPLCALVGIAAVQVALVDLLRLLGIESDGIVGHSVGELGCAYADGCFTAEQTVLAAYWRGRCIQEANLPPGGMAAVGLTWEEAGQRCPEGVVPACHNAAGTVTISGVKDKVEEFVAQLKAEGVFAKEVFSSGVAFHSHYMQLVKPALTRAFSELITDPKKRSERWVSSSIPEADWSTDLARFSSAAYHVNNVLSPVLFQEALAHVPKDAITLEIAPHCLLQAILKRSLGTGIVLTSLMKRNHQNNLEYLLSNLGKLYLNGVNVDPMRLFPGCAPVFPVPPGTPMISPLIKLDHSQSWDVPKAEDFLGGGANNCVFEIEMGGDSEHNYLKGHKIDGRLLFPATGYLVMAWKALAKELKLNWLQMPVEFKDTSIQRATVLPSSGKVKFDVQLLHGGGCFEVCEGGSVVASGTVLTAESSLSEEEMEEEEGHAGDAKEQEEEEGKTPNGNFQMHQEDVYKELRLRGYEYGETFQGIVNIHNKGLCGQLLWRENWVSFLDSMLQMSILQVEERSLRLPTRIRSLVIDPKLHEKKMRTRKSGEKVLFAELDPDVDTCYAGGVEITGLHATTAPRRHHVQQPTLEKHLFVPYIQTNTSHANSNLSQYTEATKKYLAKRVHEILDNEKQRKEETNGLCEDIIKADIPKNGDHFDYDKLEKYLGNPKCVLLHILQQVAHTDNGEFENNVKNLLRSEDSDLSKDVLLGNLLDAQTLKPLLDVVMENSISQTMKFVEVEADVGGLYERVPALLQSQPKISMNYIATASNPKSLDEERMSSLGVQKEQWAVEGVPPSLAEANLVLARNYLCNQENIASNLAVFADILQEGGFLLIKETTRNFVVSVGISLLGGCSGTQCKHFLSEGQWEELLKEAGFTVIMRVSDGLLSTMFLCRKESKLDSESAVIYIDDHEYSWVSKVKESLASEADVTSSQRVWLASRCQPTSGIIGLVNCLRLEPGGERIRCVFNASLSDEEMPDISGETFKALQQRDLVMNIWRDGSWGSFRHLPALAGERPTVKSEHAFVNVQTRGDLSSLTWYQSPLKHFSPIEGSTKQIYNVYYSALNFRDIMLATGKLPPDAIPGHAQMQDCLLGMEFSGRDKAGHRVMGLLPAKGLATTVDADSRFIWPVPENWTLEQAASVPVVYATVYYALLVRGRLKRGQRVLVHSGSGGVGQAAISVALHLGCEVFTTVGTQEKKDFLKERFPALKEKNFCNSRDTTFEKRILKFTKGRGVDMVLNSLSEDKLQASLRLVAPHGCFLEIGKFDLSQNNSLGMAIFLKNITFHGILLDSLFDEDNSDWHQVSALLTEGICTGAVQPLPTKIFTQNKIEPAFRFMAQGKHIGKVLIKMRDEESERLVAPTPLYTQVHPRSSCHPQKSYIITGGLGGFGMELAHWLISRGARKLVLTSRRGVCNGYQAHSIHQWKEQGVSILVSTDNISHLDGARKLFEDAKSLGPVGGLFHLAVVLRDGLFENQSAESFQVVGETKVLGCRNLDVVSRQECQEGLDWFVVFSSVSCGRGNAGQSNYGYANSFMERVCEKRQHDGLPGLAIQWGAIGDVGLLQDSLGSSDVVIGGTVPQRLPSCLGTLDLFLNQPHPVLSSFVMAEKATKKEGGDGVSLIDAVANVLGVSDISTLNPHTSFSDMGLDSLMGVEIKQVLERDHDIIMNISDIQQLTINKLTTLSSGNTTSAKESSDNNNKASKLDFGIHLRYDVKNVVPKQNVVPLNEVPSGPTPLFIIHPIEGSVLPLMALCSKLKCPVYGLQCTPEAPLTTIEEIATFYLKQINADGRYKKIHLAGYSFGACVAFEMGVQLKKQAEGAAVEVVSLTLLDGSHSYVSNQYRQAHNRFGKGNQAVMEAEALCALVSQFFADGIIEFMKTLLSAVDFNSRLQLAVDRIMSTKIFSSREEVELAANAFYRRVIMASQYEPTHSYQGDINLVRALTRRGDDTELESDYGLSKVVKGQVSVSVVEGDHESFITGENADKVASIMDTMLTAKQQV